MIILGILFFILFLSLTGLLWAQILNTVFSIREKYLNIPLGFFTSLLLLSFGASIFVVWYKITPAVVVFLYTVLLALPFVLRAKINTLVESIPLKEELFGIFSKRKFLLFCFFALAILQIVILVLCQTDIPLTTPWQVVHPWYLYNFFLLTFLLGVLLFSKISYTTKFFLVVGYSLLLHLYLPLSHVNPWGGDVWRMIGVEQKLVAGEAQLPVLPTALWNPYKYTYGQLWGLMAVLTKTLGISLVALHRWLMPLVWGLMLPILGLLMGKIVFGEKKKALLFAPLCSFPFALQAIGSITVSVSLGFLNFLFGLVLWFTYLQEKKSWQKRMVFALGILMLFGYALYALLFWFVMGISLGLKKLWNGDVAPAWREYSQKQKIICIGIFIASIFIFPLVDFVLGFSHIPHTFSIFNFFKQIVGQFGGWYFARPISAQEISSANILFSHVSEHSYVANIFSSVRWPLIPVSIFIGLSIGRAFYCFIKKDKTLLSHIFALLFMCVVGGYIIGWYVLTGDRVFVRRLDSVFAFLLIIFTLYGIFSVDVSKVISKISVHKKYISFFIILTVLSFVATTIYSTGPHVRVVSGDEHKTAQYIFSQQKSDVSPCVLSNTWILLALEGVSSGSIVGGGFPITNNFGQTERVKLYSELLKNPDIRIVPQLSSVMPVPYCYIALSRDDLDPRTEQRLHDFLGDLVFKSGSVLVWKMELKNP